MNVPRAPANAPRVRRVRAAEQGPLDWLVPFIPPVLRVNRETRDTIRQKLAQLLSKETLQSAALALRPYWRPIAVYLLLLGAWIRGLAWIHHHEPEFAVAYVILSGFAALGYHMMAGESNATGGMSAYSVFNRGTQRMLGSLSAEQFENEIRHRQPGYEEALEQTHHDGGEAQGGGHDGDNDDDPELLAALQLSLKEQKREARRARRTNRRTH